MSSLCHLSHDTRPNLAEEHLCLQAGTSIYILTLAFVTSILPSGFGEIAAIVGVIGCVTNAKCIRLHVKADDTCSL